MARTALLKNDATSSRQYSTVLSRVYLQDFTKYLDEKFYNRDHIIFLQTGPYRLLFTVHLKVMVKMTVSESLDSHQCRVAQVCIAVFTNNSGQPRGPYFSDHLLGRLEAA